jgi:stage V sporulation protein AD (spoVAD)
MAKLISEGTIELDRGVSVYSCAAAVGKMESDGPLGNCFDYAAEGAELGLTTWEKAESTFQQYAFDIALRKGKLIKEDISFIFAGDLLNQCTGSAYGLRDTDISFIGLYGACSTMAESLAMASLFADMRLGEYFAAVTSSHFCSAERQFRFPINYGGVRPPTAQWTATGAGCCITSVAEKPPYVKRVTIGKITDMGIKDANNMGAAMAPAAANTIADFLKDTSSSPSDFDMILTGDLGKVGSRLLCELLQKDCGIDIESVHADCGLLLYDIEKQDVHAGGSGCGCGASVLNSYIMRRLESGELSRVLFVATGALMSPTSSLQGESIPSIAHAVLLSKPT